MNQAEFTKSTVSILNSYVQISKLNRRKRQFEDGLTSNDTIWNCIEKTITDFAGFEESVNDFKFKYKERQK